MTVIGRHHRRWPVLLLLLVLAIMLTGSIRIELGGAAKKPKTMCEVLEATWEEYTRTHVPSAKDIEIYERSRAAYCPEIR